MNWLVVSHSLTTSSIPFSDKKFAGQALAPHHSTPAQKKQQLGWLKQGSVSDVVDRTRFPGFLRRSTPDLHSISTTISPGLAPAGMLRSLPSPVSSSRPHLDPSLEQAGRRGTRIEGYQRTVTGWWTSHSKAFCLPCQEKFLPNFRPVVLENKINIGRNIYPRAPPDRQQIRHARGYRSSVLAGAMQASSKADRQLQTLSPSPSHADDGFRLAPSAGTSTCYRAAVRRSDPLVHLTPDYRRSENRRRITQGGMRGQQPDSEYFYLYRKRRFNTFLGIHAAESRERLTSSTTDQPEEVTKLLLTLRLKQLAFQSMKPTAAASCFAPIRW